MLERACSYIWVVCVIFGWCVLYLGGVLFVVFAIMFLECVRKFAARP